MTIGLERKRDRTTGIGIVVVAFFGSLSVSWWASVKSAPITSEPPPPPTSEGLEGYPKSIDALQVLEQARASTPRDQLRNIVAVGVKQDGTIDLTKPGSRVRYVFQSRRGRGPQPPRPKGTLARRAYCGKQTVHVRKDGLRVDPDKPKTPCRGAEHDALPDPQCSFKKIWDYAIEHRKVPKKNSARIEYYRAKGGPAYRFQVPGTAYRFVLYGDCQSELKGSDTYGVKP